MYFKSTVFNREGLRIGKNVVWNEGCHFNAEGGLTIHNNVLIGPNVCIATSNHNYMDKNKLIWSQGHTAKPVVIEEDVWIGANATILSGVTLGRGCVVGAGSIVTKSVPPYYVVAGNPATPIKTRLNLNQEHLQKENCAIQILA